MPLTLAFPPALAKASRRVRRALAGWLQPEPEISVRVRALRPDLVPDGGSTSLGWHADRDDAVALNEMIASARREQRSIPLGQIELRFAGWKDWTPVGSVPGKIWHARARVDYPAGRIVCAARGRTYEAAVAEASLQLPDDRAGVVEIEDAAGWTEVGRGTRSGFRLTAAPRLAVVASA